MGIYSYKYIIRGDNKMNFEEFKNQYFNGDEDRALAHCAYESYYQDYVLTGNQENLQKL